MKFTVYARNHQILKCEIEAENEYEAWKIAKEQEEQEFYLESGEWEIIDVEEIK